MTHAEKYSCLELPRSSEMASGITYSGLCQTSGAYEVDLTAATRYAIVALGEINTIPIANNHCIIRVLELQYDSEEGKYVPNDTTVPHVLVGAR